MGLCILFSNSFAPLFTPSERERRASLNCCPLYTCFQDVVFHQTKLGYVVVPSFTKQKNKKKNQFPMQLISKALEDGSLTNGYPTSNHFDSKSTSSTYIV